MRTANRIMLGILAALLALSAAALAAPGGGGHGAGGRGEGEGRGKGEGHPPRRPPVVFGTLKTVDGDTWTLKPEVPPHVKERREERGAPERQLPESITVNVGGAQFWLDGAVASAGSFKAGDKVVIKLARPPKGERGEGERGEGAREGKGERPTPTAEIVADPETAREMIMEKMKEKREEKREKNR